jgi:hypothetical protein
MEPDRHIVMPTSRGPIEPNVITLPESAFRDLRAFRGVVGDTEAPGPPDPEPN